MTVMVAHSPPEEAAKLLLPDLYEAPIAGVEHVERETESIMDDAHAEHLHRREMERKDLEHTHYMERRQLAAAVWESRAGQIIAFVIVLLVIGAGAWLINNDKSGWGFALILLELAGLAGAFLYNDRRRRAEQQQSRETFPQEPQH